MDRRVSLKPRKTVSQNCSGWVEPKPTETSEPEPEDSAFERRSVCRLMLPLIKASSKGSQATIGFGLKKRNHQCVVSASLVPCKPTPKRVPAKKDRPKYLCVWVPSKGATLLKVFLEPAMAPLPGKKDKWKAKHPSENWADFGSLSHGLQMRSPPTQLKGLTWSLFWRVHKLGWDFQGIHLF